MMDLLAISSFTLPFRAEVQQSFTALRRINISLQLELETI